MKKFPVSIIILAVIAGSAQAAGASVKEDVKNGNILYNKGDFNGAAKKYGLALADKSDRDVASFNLGAALYKDKSYSGGMDSFNKAIAFGGDHLRQESDYNIGNSYFRIGNSKEAKDYKGAKESYETALKFYKRSIDLNPVDLDAKFNYEITARRLSVLKEPPLQPKEAEKEDKKDNKKDKQGQNKDQNQDKNQDQNKDQNQGQSKDQKQNQGQDQSKEKKPEDKNQDQNQGQNQKSGNESGSSEGDKDTPGNGYPDRDYRPQAR